MSRYDDTASQDLNFWRGLGWGLLLSVPFWLVLGGACLKAWQR